MTPLWNAHGFHGLVLACLIALTLQPPAGAAQRSYWTISGSPVDPLVLEGEPSGGLDTLYIWLVCTNADLPTSGMSAAEFGLEGTLTPLSLTPSGGCLNAGSVTSPMLAATGCPPGPFMVASVLIQHDKPGFLCFGPSINGYNATVDCSTNPVLWPNYFQGYSSQGSPCSNLCPEWLDCSCSLSVDASSWGFIKSLYR